MRDSRRRRIGTAVAFAALVVAVGHVTSSTALSAKAKKYGYVTSDLLIPVDSEEADEFARDIDHDGTRDNALGNVFTTLAGQGFDFQAVLDEAIAQGDLLMLHSLKMPSFRKTKEATWQVLFAEPTPVPDFSGAGTFTIDDNAPRSSRLKATIKRHKLKTKAGDIPLRLDLGIGTFDLAVEAGKIYATCSESSCTDARINGAVTAEEIDAILIPQLATLWTAAVTRDCPGPGLDSCMSGSEGETIQGLFDENNDLVITSGELRENDLIQTLFRPDVKLGQGEPNAISIGLGFETVSAQLQNG